MTRPSVRYLYHPARDKIYEVYFRRDQALVVSLDVRSQGRRGNPRQIWDRIMDGEPTRLVREVIAMCEANIAGDRYDDARAAMHAAFEQWRIKRGLTVPTRREA